VPGGSIYVPPDDKFTGASPQQMYEKFWVEGTTTRRRARAVKAAVGLAAGIALAVRFSLPGPVLVGLVVAAVTAAADAAWSWYSHASTAVWRGRRRGEVITGRLLRRALSRRGYRVLDGRAVRGQTSIDHLVIGPGGVWIVDNEAWGPETEIARYGDRLFLGEKYGRSVAEGLVAASRAFAEVLSRESGVPVTIEPLLAVHGGRLPRGGTLTAEGLTLLRPRLVARHVLAHGTAALSADQVEALARTAARELRRLG
jgi:hypothetical protein